MVLPDAELGKLVVSQGLIDEKGIKELITFAQDTKIPLYTALIEKGIATDEQLGNLVASTLKLPFVVLTKITIPAEVLSIIPPRVARLQKVIAFEKSDDGLKVASANPASRQVLSQVAQKTGLNVIAYYATDRDIEATLQTYQKDLQKTINELLREEIQETPGQPLEDPPVAKIVDELIQAAYQDKASDIHTEPEEGNSQIRFRIDGVLHDVLQIPKNLHDRVVTRIKVLSRLRTDEHLSAQDGKMQMQLPEENLDIRVSIVPIADGEKVVMRLLSSRSRQYSLTDLGMSETDLTKVTNAYHKSYGMILATGPTGCGKTTTIYAILKILNTREKNITTIEDPVEYRILGTNQIQVNAKTNLTFANGLRSILRQDPNIIFVGEIRDSETAGIAVNAALTGHLVLSTLHTNDAATAIPRLIDMKVEPFLVASTVNIIVAQRLVRKICDLCKTSQTVATAELAKQLPPEAISRYFGEKTEITTYKGRGCKICHLTGYSGRVGIFEVLEVSKKIRQLITSKADSDVITAGAVAEGMTTMIDDGFDKVNRGLTTIEEVMRVTKVEFL